MTSKVFERLLIGMDGERDSNESEPSRCFGEDDDDDDWKAEKNLIIEINQKLITTSRKDENILLIDWFLYLMAYQPLYAIEC